MDELKQILDQKLSQYYNADFIPLDPISIPHRYIKKQDIEISAFLASIMAWGRRSVIINKASQLLIHMGSSPYEFVMSYSVKDLKYFEAFKHRTINSIDISHLIRFLHDHYMNYDSLEDAFAMHMCVKDENVEKGLVGFHNLVFSLDNSPHRTRKHIATPIRKSSCKRMNMFLRWMVRKDNVGVDFGLWKKISPHQLICPCDVHVMNISKKYNLISGNIANWATAVELTNNLKKFCPQDPVKYDFALFGLGIDK
jgi:uncharacterized protein (TIGR02757 family)